MIRQLLSNTQTAAVAMIGVKQPTLDDAIKCHYHKFTIDQLLVCSQVQESDLTSL